MIHNAFLRPIFGRVTSLYENGGVSSSCWKVIYKSGFEVQWWPEAMTCYCFLRGVTDVMKDGFTPYKFLKNFKGATLRNSFFSPQFRSKLG